MFCFLCVYFTKKQWCKFISEEALEFIFSTAKVKLHFSCINHNKQMLKYCWNPAELVIFKLWIELVDEREDQKVSFYGNWSDELVSLVKCAKHSRQQFHSCLCFKLTTIESAVNGLKSAIFWQFFKIGLLVHPFKTAHRIFFFCFLF